MVAETLMRGGTITSGGVDAFFASMLQRAALVEDIGRAALTAFVTGRELPRTAPLRAAETHSGCTKPAMSLLLLMTPRDSVLFLIL
jgi:type VI protein secretion system component VasA